eukprot:353399-Chlamydomonas_euryale.AAC.2
MHAHAPERTCMHQHARPHPGATCPRAQTHKRVHTHTHTPVLQGARLRRPPPRRCAALSRCPLRQCPARAPPASARRPQSQRAGGQPCGLPGPPGEHLRCGGTTGEGGIRFAQPGGPARPSRAAPAVSSSATGGGAVAEQQ